MTDVASSPSARSARLGLRATPAQEVILRRAAAVAHKSLTDFILDSACLAAEQTLLDRPEQANDGLRDLFARQAPWDTQ